MIWWEKTVEYKFFLHMLERGLISIFPLDGNPEEAGDAILNFEGNFLLIEFKRTKKDIDSENKKFKGEDVYFENGELLPQLGNKGESFFSKHSEEAKAHFFIYGEFCHDGAIICAQNYWYPKIEPDAPKESTLQEKISQIAIDAIPLKDAFDILRTRRQTAIEEISALKEEAISYNSFQSVIRYESLKNGGKSLPPESILQKGIDREAFKKYVEDFINLKGNNASQSGRFDSMFTNVMGVSNDGKIPFILSLDKYIEVTREVDHQREVDNQIYDGI
ncbi:hypothetical protein [Aminobacterium sp. EBM-42]|uniref:hypothetical protein n=1 Tax=Aminobacterium sp. EBM-42 TaxID=1918503 RepID=UPI00257961BA|nr:hypothetical protein [Aminobacterium sp. EBM-42]